MAAKNVVLGTIPFGIPKMVCYLRWLKTVSSTFQDVDIDGS